MNPVFILAGRYDHARHLAHEIGLTRFKYVTEPHQFLGVAPGALVFEMETARENRGYPDLLHFIRTRGLQHVTISLDLLLGVIRP